MHRGKWIWIFVAIGATGALAIAALFLLVTFGSDGHATLAAPSGGAGGKDADAVVSYEACKPAWRQTRTTLAGLPKEQRQEDVIKKLDTLIAMPKEAWGTDAGIKAVEAAAFNDCAPDDKGAWALVLRKPEAPDGKRGCGDVLQELQRIANDGKVISARSDSNGPGDCDTQLGNTSPDKAGGMLTTVPDMNQDGVPEVTLYQSGFPSDENTTGLFTSLGGTVKPYPGTERISIEDVSDHNGDGRPDVGYHYLYAGIVPGNGCGSVVPMWHYSPTLVALTGQDGTLAFDGPEARALARTVCPGAPEAPEEDAFCTLLWGFQDSGIPDYDKVQARCVASYANDDKEAERDARREQHLEEGDTPGCVDYPSREGCVHYEGWGELAKKKLPLSLWPPVASEQLSRTDEENAAIAASYEAFKRARQAMGHKDWDGALAAYREAAEHTDEPELVEGEMAYAQLRGGDAAGAEKAIASFVDGMADRQAKAASLYNLGLALEARDNKSGAARAFLRSNALHASKDARSKLGKSKVCPVDIALEKSGMAFEAWKKSAGDEETALPGASTKGDYYMVGSGAPGFEAYDAFRFPAGKRDAAYKLDPLSGKVSRCLVANGCTCTAASPCARGARPRPTAMHEYAVFSRGSNTRLAYATWPDDADPERKIEISVIKDELTVTGLGCSQKVKLVP